MSTRDHLSLVVFSGVVDEQLVVFVATFRVARLTLQTRTLWLVGVATVTRVTFDLPECKDLKIVFFFFFFLKKKKKLKNQKQSRKEKIKIIIK